MKKIFMSLCIIIVKKRLIIVLFYSGSMHEHLPPHPYRLRELNKWTVNWYYWILPYLDPILYLLSRLFCLRPTLFFRNVLRLIIYPTTTNTNPDIISIIEWHSDCRSCFNRSIPWVNFKYILETETSGGK